VKPNVLLIISDQEQNHIDWPGLNTPQQNRLKENGVAFSHAYTTTPQCSPARASLMTGLLPCENNVFTNVDETSMGIPLSTDMETLGNFFKESGYKTAYFGKWHIGNHKQLNKFGFDIFDVGDYLIRTGIYDVSEVEDRIIADKAAKWLYEQDNEPWFCIVAINNPHDIYLFNKKENYPIRDSITMPNNFKDNLLNKPVCQKDFLENDQGKPFNNANEKRWLEYRSMYYDLIEDADKSLEIILDVLDKKDIWQDTLLIYTSDHGDLTGAHGMPYKAPCMYEELINIPMYIVWDTHLPKNTVCNALVSHIDVASTICSLLNVKPRKKLSGIDLVMTANGKHPGHQQIFCEYTAKQKWFNPIKTIRTKQWKYNHYLNDSGELYDLAQDPYEMKNLIAEPEYKNTLNHLRQIIFNQFKLQN
jgi:arylsulfatase A-like enzyme